MKKIFIVVGIILGLVILAAFLVPVIFKDDIRTAVDKALAESVNADFVFDTNDFEVSMISNFPNPAATLRNFGIINREPFEGEILFAVEELKAVISLSSLLFGDQIKIKGVIMENPRAFLKVLENGKANWDIAITTEDLASQPDTAAVKYNIGIDHWEIKNGNVVYEDLSIPFKLTAAGLNHKGSGDFTQDIVDMETYSLIDSLSVWFDGTRYVSDKTAEMDVTLKISEEYERYDFQENRIRINDFAFGFGGGFKMLPDGFDLDLRFDSQDNSFKSLLSLLPGMYHKDFEKIDASGDLQFKGMVKGIFDSLYYPAFDLTLNVNDASFKYPEVEESFRDINMKLNLSNPTDNIENTRIALDNFHMNMGGKPIDGRLIVENLVNYPVDGALKGSINLEDLNKVMPMEGLSMRGNLDIDVTANGIYDSVKQIMPQVNGKFLLTKGYIKSTDFPATLDNFNINTLITNTTGKFSDFVMNLSQFNFNMDGEPFEGRMTLRDLNNINWDLIAKGNVDLEKLSKILSLQDMELRGKVAADINTKGNMAALEAENYAQLPTSGILKLTGFYYSDPEMPYVLTMSEVDASFNPQRMEIRKMEGTIGKSDFSMEGNVTNYMGYALSDNESLKGNFTFRSANLDLNEFMEDEEDAPTVQDTGEAGVIEVPKNLDLTLTSNIKRAQMLDMEMRNVTGVITAKDGIARMSNVNFDLLDGKFTVNGAYNPTDVKNPKYDFALNIKDLPVKQAFQQFEIVKKYVPIADNITGTFSTDFSLNGLLTQQMTPDLTTVTGKGLVKIIQAALEDSKILNGLTSATKLADTEDVFFRDLSLYTSIEDGRLVVQPFDISLAGHPAVISGSTGVDGSIDYLVKMNLPAGQVAQVFNQFTGNLSSNETIALPIVISGTYSDPKFSLQTQEIQDELKQAAKDKAKEEVKEEVKDVLDKAVKDDKIRDVIGGVLGGKKDTVQKADTTEKEEIKEKIEEEAKEKIKNFFKKKN